MSEFRQSRAVILMAMLVFAWRVVLGVVFCIFCVQVHWAVAREATPHPGPGIVLGLGGLFLGLWSPTAALYAFSASFFILAGLERCVLVAVPPMTLIFTSVALGILIRRTGLSAKPLIKREQRQIDWPTWRIVACKTEIAKLSTDLLATILLSSLVWQIHRRGGWLPIMRILTSRSTFGFGEEYYFFTSAFLWLKGIAYFRLLLAQQSPSARSLHGLVRIHSVTIMGFWIFQTFTDVPDPYLGLVRYAPLEDISSFGSVCAVSFIYLCAMFANGNQKKPVKIVFVIITAFLLIASWSRAAWAWGFIGVTILAWVCLSKKAACLLIALGIGAGLAVNLAMLGSKPGTNSYVVRFLHLVKLENPIHKDPTRINLFAKAIRMIEARPLYGHGIGSFYKTSTFYAPPSDPLGNRPDFAHNAFLQFASEVGCPAMLILTGLVISGILTGCFFTTADNTLAPDAAALFGCGFALATYLGTQLTANSLNVYESNQFMFWLLLAALFNIRQIAKN